MTPILTVFWLGAASQLQSAALPEVINPLPVLKGQIGKGKARVAPPPSGFVPVNPALLPGVTYTLRPSASGQPAAPASPSSQGPNAAFNSALDQLFASAPTPEAANQRDSTLENEVTHGREGIALPLSSGQEEIL